MLKNETNEEYHASEPVSKSVIWSALDKTPFHARFTKRKPATHFDIGTATHIAILEPDRFEEAVSRGPDVRKNTKEWKHFLDFCTAAGTVPLKGEEYDSVLVMRDLSATLPELELLRQGRTIVETSAYHVDEETGLEVKTRPDLYNVEHRLIADIKTCASASPFAFQRDVGKFGYHVQHAFYSDVWAKGSGLPVDGFLFVAFEKNDPPLVKVYELTPSAIAEGHALYRKGLALWKRCLDNDEWPGYGDGVQRIGLRRFDYKLTPPPEGEEIEGDVDEVDEDADNAEETED